jgi:hypothetical protein
VLIRRQIVIVIIRTSNLAGLTMSQSKQPGFLEKGWFLAIEESKV